ncbi:PDR/VanB family oxidoreductase [Parafrankia sp. EUN1f]|uniref:PDR/VanB family oxidoreductase n=1 Tax=Parafrankia sp. EUN1f TaxID=102897 RepID=UPI0001C467C3|nr:PDR/VanB family oxidoreductase [Parafrankia sp. EUN1f]EFC81079.1 ferredoxin [Parafrankia sp. EUN1f]
MRTQEQTADLVVQQREAVADGVVCLTMARPDGGAVPDWEPGAHIDLLLGPGAGAEPGPGSPAGAEERFVRQYSLCGDPGDPSTLRIAVLRAPGGRGGSAYVHDRIGPGDVVRTRGPRNHFALVDSPEYLFVAGGIGITPIMPMIERAEAAGAEWTLLYGGRTRSSMAFAAQLTDRHGDDRVMVRPEDEFGLLDLAGFLGAPRDRVAIYCCGPEPLLAALEQLAGPWPAGTLHLERFSPKQIADAPAAGGFVVELARSGTAVTVPAGRSIVDALADAGVRVPTSCREGTCGTCETAVISGVPDHRDSLLTEDERESGTVLMPCVSRALSPVLVLDL